MDNNNKTVKTPLNTSTGGQSIPLAIIRVLIAVYTYLSLPVYYLIQKPWRVLAADRRPRASREVPDDPYSPWVRCGQLPGHYLDECRTLPEAQRRSLEVNGPDRRALGYRRVSGEEMVKQTDGKVMKKWLLSDYQWLTAGEADQRIGDIARGLLINGVKPKDTVLIFADTRLEWLLSAQAVFRVGAAITTLYATLGADGLVHGINETAVTHVITTEDLLPQLAKIGAQTPTVRTVVYMAYGYKKGPAVQFPPGVELVTFEQLESDGRCAPKKLIGVEPTEDDVALIMYTSGSTGVPKGVVVTHKQILAAFHSIRTLFHERFDHPEPRQTYLAYLPLSHTLEFCAEAYLFSCGVKIGYGTPYTLTNAGTALPEGTPGDITLLRPTFMASVPLILDRIRRDIELNVSKRGQLFKSIFNYIIEYKVQWLRRGFRTPIIDRLICSGIRSQIGGRLEFMMVGGAPLNVDTHDFLRACLNIKLCQGYGSTELIASATSMDFDDLSTGGIGGPLFGVKIRLVDWDEGGYKVTDQPESRGEAVVGGHNVALGYHGLDELTAEAFETTLTATPTAERRMRWFRTGDIVAVSADGLFRIIDRKKDFVKLQFGEYISLGKVELELKNFRFVDNVCVYGDSYRSYLIAIVIPNQKAMQSLAEQLLTGVESDKLIDLCRNPKIIHHVQNELRQYCQQGGKLHKMEIPARVMLCPEEWTTGNGLVTPALKIRRKNIQNFYQARIDQLYA